MSAQKCLLVGAVVVHVLEWFPRDCATIAVRFENLSEPVASWLKASLVRREGCTSAAAVGQVSSEHEQAAPVLFLWRPLSHPRVQLRAFLSAELRRSTAVPAFDIPERTQEKGWCFGSLAGVTLWEEQHLYLYAVRDR